MTPRLSVVVPFYNVGDYIADCLDSIAKQTYRDFEAILVDDGSLDDSAAIAKEFCARDARFRIVAQENQGLGPARNTGARHAEGEFLTFVDSDDLVTRHAYEKMVRSLDETGSSFVGGNARRFNNSSGVRQSWVQRVPFARNRMATHISEFPELVLDRMVWNKVYRRSFWDEFGYQFPAIRYEDYPVTLKAHLDALTVDVLAAPVYYWRERESGESITQQRFQYGNLLDRVISAEIVMDLVDDRAPELRRRLHALLAQVDLVALVQAFGSVPVDQQATLTELGRRLIDRLDPAVLAGCPSYDRLQQHALKAGDGDLLRRLAEFRQDGGLRGGGLAKPQPGRPWHYEYQYPGLGDGSSVPRSLYRVPRRALSLFTSVTDVAWHGTALRVRGTAEMPLLPLSARSRLAISLAAGKTRIPLPVRRFETLDSHGDQSLVGFEVEIDARSLAAIPAETQAGFVVTLRAARFRRQTRLRNPRAGSPGWAPGGWIDASTWIQPGAEPGGAFVLKRLDDPWQLTGATAQDDAFVLSGRLPADVEDPRLELTRTLSGEDLVLDLETAVDETGIAFTGRIPLAPIVGDANPDDPFTQRTSRGVRVAAEDGGRMLLWTGPTRAVSQVHGGRLLVLSRSTGNYVNLHESPIRLAADQVSLESAPTGQQLVLSGPLWSQEAGQVFTWRRFFEDSDDHLDVACRRTVDTTGDQDRWSASVELAELIPVESIRQTVDPLASLADWILFVTGSDGSAYAVQSEAFLTSRLPVRMVAGENSASLQTRAGTLHLEVR